MATYVLIHGGARVMFTFAPRNDFGVLDHDVTLPSGKSVHNLHGLSQDFKRDADAVAKDLVTLKSLVEAKRAVRMSGCPGPLSRRAMWTR